MIGLLLGRLYTIGLLLWRPDTVRLRLRRLDALRLLLLQLEALWLMLQMEGLCLVLFFIALLRLIFLPFMLIFPALKWLFLAVGRYAHSDQPHRADYNCYNYPAQEIDFHHTPP